MQAQTTSHDGDAKRGNSEDHEYDDYLLRIGRRFAQNMSSRVPLFTTDAYTKGNSALWDAYLNAFPPDQRQFHNCSCCRHFIQRFGSLVTITEGRTASPIWEAEDAPEMYRPSVAAMLRVIRRAKVTGVFLSELTLWGHGRAGVWRHFSVSPPSGMLFRRTLKTARQTMAEKREEHHTVARALSEITPAVLLQAVTLLKTDALFRSEKVLGAAEWLLAVSEERRTLSGELRENALWRQVALAPSGFCHPRSSMLGTLLEDIETGLPFEDMRRKFSAKMSPILYQRPQAAPSAGNIAQAEKLVEQLGIAPSLRRRFARLDDVLEFVWRPVAQAEQPAAGGVFGHLRPKGDQPSSALRIPPQVMTWEKFSRTVLPDARAIDLLVPSGRASFAALVTASIPDSPPILQWDDPRCRNPVSWYLYHGGSHATNWGLTANVWATVTGITLQPSQWFGAALEHQGVGAFMLLQGCRDSSFRRAGLGLFPECLKSELREVRSTVEAFSKAGEIEGHEESSACGIKLQKGSPSDVHVRVVGANGPAAEYKIDRWD